MTDYEPVSCALHSAYELAIMRRRKINLAWRDEQGVKYSARVLPLDLQTRHHEEFLLVEHDGLQEMIRLDRVLSAP